MDHKETLEKQPAWNLDNDTVHARPSMSHCECVYELSRENSVSLLVLYLERIHTCFTKFLW